ncbi:MAG: hypothetical protein ACR2PX_21010 [Endozoicomonas sp.]|uniref:hypothetical protein n=1 Tax=Endozoicomonas sp. TaxID=1892382 RepID=UPI003D9B8188
MNIELFQAATASIGLLSFIIALINSIVFYRKYYKKLAEKIDGADYDYGFLFSANRFMVWGQYCLFPKLKNNIESEIILNNTTQNQRHMLKLHYIMVFIGCISFIVSAVLAS